MSKEGKTIVSDRTRNVTMADALAAAQSEMGEATPVVEEAGLPPVEPQDGADTEQAAPSSGEQPATDESGQYDEATTAFADSLLDTVEESQNGSDPGAIVPGSDDFWNLGVEVQTASGPQTISVREATDGYLRQADYTRKTQELAEARKHNTRASEFLAAFESDPTSFTRSLALQAGLIAEGDTPVREVEIAKIPSAEDVQAMVDARAQELMQSDPSVVDAKRIAAEAQVNTEFDRLESVFEIPISPDLRNSLIAEAQQKRTGDLEGLLAKRVWLAQQKESRAGRQQHAATSRPGQPPQGVTDPDGGGNVEKPSMAEAFRMAQMAAAQQ